LSFDLDPQQWVNRLTDLHQTSMPRLRRLNQHYDLEQPLSYMHPELWLEVSDRIKPVLIAWPQVVIDSIEERLDVTGFRVNTSSTVGDDARLWDWWQANNLDEGSEQEHLEALIAGRAFVIVGTREDDETVPLITVETPLQVFAAFDPQTRKVRAAIKEWIDGNEQFTTLYLPDDTIRYTKTGTGELEKIGHDNHQLGIVPVVPFVNRGRMTHLDKSNQIGPPGRSELAAILPLSEAACKIATDMMVAAETVAIPARYAFGLSKDDFVDEAGNPVSAWKAVLGKMLIHEDPDIKVGQWPAADLGNFHTTLNELARVVAAVAALPPHYLGFTTDNPASADAIRSNEARLVKRAERKQVSFGESWEQVMSLSERIIDGEWNPDARRLETRWRDAATPTKSQAADAVQKLVQAKIIPIEQAREDLGYTEGQRLRMNEWDAARTERDANAMMFGAAAGAADLLPKEPPAPMPIPAAGM
jgi:Phage portal protein, SPP1 Gp6-like